MLPTEIILIILQHRRDISFENKYNALKRKADLLSKEATLEANQWRKESFMKHIESYRCDSMRFALEREYMAFWWW
jgi:hypothetical protein